MFRQTVEIQYLCMLTSGFCCFSCDCLIYDSDEEAGEDQGCPRIEFVPVETEGLIQPRMQHVPCRVASSCICGLWKKYRISHECKFNSEFIERVEWKYIMRASGEYNIILFNVFNKFSIEQARISHTSKRELLILKKKDNFHQHAYNVTLMFSALLTLKMISRQV